LAEGTVNWIQNNTYLIVTQRVMRNKLYYSYS